MPTSPSTPSSRPTQANGRSKDPAVSADGRYVVFASYASNLVAGDTNQRADIFLRDTVAGTTTCLSAGLGGQLANDWSQRPSITPDGRYVVFESEASNLVAGDTNGSKDIFRWDRQSGRLTRVSLADGGGQLGDASDPSISADGRYVAFISGDHRIVAGDGNALHDVFVHDIQTRRTTRVSVASSGQEADLASWREQDGALCRSPVISGNGRYVVFTSVADNLVPNDSNGVPDIFVHDRQTRTTTRVSVSTDGEQSDNPSAFPSLSRDGRYVAFESMATNLVGDDGNNERDIFLHDRATGTTTRITVGLRGVDSNSGSDFPKVAANGRWVTFASYASNLVENDTNRDLDTFMFDISNGSIERVSLTSAGQQSQSGGSFENNISPNGRFVVFSTYDGNLTTGDTNRQVDIFLRDRQTGRTTLVSLPNGVRPPTSQTAARRTDALTTLLTEQRAGQPLAAPVPSLAGAARPAGLLAALAAGP